MGLSFKNPPGDPDALHVFIKLQLYGTPLWAHLRFLKENLGPVGHA